MSAMLKMIAAMEAQLALMKVALGSTVTDKVAKEPKEPNVWIVFTQRVSAALKAAKIETGAATVSKQFASALKEQKAYADWTDEAIVAAWPLWTKPEVSKMAASKASSKASSGDESSVAGDKPQKAAKKPQSDATKAAAAVKRAATKAAKAEPKAEPNAATKAATKAKVVNYTPEQLKDFEEFEHNGEEYGKNVRGDLIDSEGTYAGHWDGKAISKGATPVDWQQIKP